MKHEIGDIVAIRDDLSEEDGKHGDYSVIRPMCKYAGATAMVTRVDSDCCRLNVDDGQFSWQGYMFKSRTKTAGKRPSAKKKNPKQKPIVKDRDGNRINIGDTILCNNRLYVVASFEVKGEGSPLVGLSTEKAYRDRCKDPGAFLPVGFVASETRRDGFSWLKNCSVVHPTEILDAKEKKYLEGVIAPFREQVQSIYIEVCFQDPKSRQLAMAIEHSATMYFPPFKAGTMYVGMGITETYTPAELGLFKEEQK